MFFKGLIEQLADVPRYFRDGIYDSVSSDRLLIEEGRKILGAKNKLLGWKRMEERTRSRATGLCNYLMCIQLPLLKNFVPYEMLVVAPGTCEEKDGISLRYADKIGELVVVPLTGVITTSSIELQLEPVQMIPGHVYRLNNRVPMKLSASDDALSFCCLMIDFDLRHYLMDWDLSGRFDRKPEEHVTSLVDQPVEVQETY